MSHGSPACFQNGVDAPGLPEGGRFNDFERCESHEGFVLYQ